MGTVHTRLLPVLPCPAALLAGALQPCPPVPSEPVVSVAVGWLRACGFQVELTGLSCAASTAWLWKQDRGDAEGRITQQRTF